MSRCSTARLRSRSPSADPGGMSGSRLAHRRGSSRQPPLALCPELLERPPLRRREVASARPASPERQPAERAARAPGGTEHGRRKPRQHVIEARPFGRIRPHPEKKSCTRPHLAIVEGSFPPASHQPGQRDLHRADLFATSAEARCVREIAAFADAEEGRSQHGADRPGVDRAVGMPADRSCRPGSGSCTRRTGCSAGPLETRF